MADACAGADDASHARALHVMDLYRPLVRGTTVAAPLDATDWTTDRAEPDVP